MEAFQALEASFGSMPVAFTVIKVIQDENGHTVDLKFRYLNQAFADLYGRVKEDLLGACFYELFPLEAVSYTHLDVYKRQGFMIMMVLDVALG